MRILLVEDNVDLAEGLRETLQDEGETVDWFVDGRDALKALGVERFDLVVLDLGLPGLDGLSVLKKLREGSQIHADNRDVPVLVLTARDQISDRVTGLDTGADDYLVKPFDIDELLARSRALYRRSMGRSQTVLSFNGLSIFPNDHSVLLDEQPLSLSRREYALLSTLAENPNRVLSKQRLSEAIYGWGEEVESNALEVHIHNLRKKLKGRYIRNRRGLGYLFSDQDDAA